MAPFRAAAALSSVFPDRGWLRFFKWRDPLHINNYAKDVVGIPPKAKKPLRLVFARN